MKYSNILCHGSAIALISMLVGCSTWQSMDHQEKGTAAGGAAGGTVGAGAGGYTGRNEANDMANGAGSSATETASPVIRSAQMALNRKGYAAGEADGVLGPSTENAVRQFQEVQRLPITGTLDQDTLSALGISQ